MSDDAERDELVDDETIPEDVDEAELEEMAEEDPAAAFEHVGEIPGTHLRAAEFWDDILADMEATAEEYETDGWDTLQLHPGDVTALVPDEHDDRFGLDVLAPDDEFEELQGLLEGDASFDAYEVFRAMADGLVLFVVAMEDRDREIAVLYPAYYDAQNAQAMLTAAESAGEMRTYVRTLTEEQIEFTHDEPENFGPPSSEGDEGE
ncbi:DUF7529 family protein [Halorussus caseinilyticus]|uniref:DUF7529 family protein n=1 Tax=Halorussus caseinilyticus TaxID=3034025 RepID=UPI0023E83BEA|nr:hypothetical protein [Halorussus sp. DT72]